MSEQRFDPFDSMELFETAQQARQAARRTRNRRTIAVSIGIALIWACFVTLGGHWGRVADRWVAAVTMIFGSTVAGATPQGGGAVAFPVFTKLLEVPSTVARSFSLCVQTIGMGAASLAIIISERQVDWRSIRVLGPAAVTGFLASAWLIGRPDEPFWPAVLPGSYVKITFTIVVATMALLVWLSSRSWVSERIDDVASRSPRMVMLLIGSGIAGGVAAFLTGSGADVFTYLGLVALLGLSGGIGVPTSVIVMTIVSVTGMALFGLADGQLSVDLDQSGDVVRVGAHQLDEPLPGGQYDLFGMWLAAAPVAAACAQFGSWLASQFTDRFLAKVVVGLALVETISTAIFVPELRTDPWLALYAIVGLVAFSAGLVAVFRRRHNLLAIPPLDTDRTLLPRRATLDRQRRRNEDDQR